MFARRGASTRPASMWETRARTPRSSRPRTGIRAATTESPPAGADSGSLRSLVPAVTRSDSTSNPAAHPSVGHLRIQAVDLEQPVAAGADRLVFRGVALGDRPRPAAGLARRCKGSGPGETRGGGLGRPRLRVRVVFRGIAPILAGASDLSPPARGPRVARVNDEGRDRASRHRCCASMSPEPHRPCLTG